MAIIKTNKGIEILVDDDKFEELNKIRWYVNGKGYAFATTKKDGKSKSYFMHRFLTNCPKGLVVDHINANRLDNRLENLEIVTQKENVKRISNVNRDLGWMTRRKKEWAVFEV
jgi:hypothetical protein